LEIPDARTEEHTRLLNHTYVIGAYVAALVVILVLMHFSRYSLDQEFFFITISLLGLAIVYWLACFISKKEEQTTINSKIPSLDIITPVVLVLMMVFYNSAYLQELVIPYPSIDLNFGAKALFLVAAALILPGALLLSLIKSNLQSLLHFVLGLHVSLAIIGLLTFALFYIKVDIGSIFPAIMTLITTLWLLRLFKRYRNHELGRTKSSVIQTLYSERKTTINKWKISLGLMVTASVAVGLLFHTSQVYMIPGDAWRVLKPGVDLISGSNVVETASSIEYPIAYGLIVAGISQITGIPILNTNMFLFPFIIVNILTFYALVRHVFGIGQAVATTASFLYVFSGGLGWLMGNVLGLQLDFWTLSYQTQDMLFSHYFLDNIQVWHRTIATTFGFAAILTFYLSTNRSDNGKWALASLSSLFAVFSFFTHMLPLIFVVPAILYLGFRTKQSLRALLVFSVSAVLVFTISDGLLNGYYSSLTMLKIGDELLPAAGLLQGNADASTTTYGNIALAVIAASGILYVVLSRFKRISWMPIQSNSTSLSDGGFSSANNTSIFARILYGGISRLSYLAIIGIALIVAFFYATAVWSSFPSVPGALYLLNQLPWYFLPIRFGLVALLAAISLFFIKGKESWTGLSLVWFMTVFIIGNIWWGAKLMSFIFPVLALAAGISLHYIRENSSTVSSFLNTNRWILRVLKFSAMGALCIVIVLSTSSYVYGLSQYTGNFERDHSTIQAISWIYSNIPKDETVVLFSSDYALEVGVSNLSAHDAIISTDSRKILNQNTTALMDLGFKYFVGFENETPRSIRTEAFPVNKAGNILILQLEPYSTSAATIFNIGSGSVDITGESGYWSFNKKWQITWTEQIGLALEPEETIPKGSNLSFDLTLMQSSWNTPSSAQEVYVRLIGDQSTTQSENLIKDLDRNSSNFLLRLNSDVERIEVIVVNGGTNTASISISNVGYELPDGSIIRITGS
jgi:hypothetical protein